MTDLLDKLARAARDEEALDARIDAAAEAALAEPTETYDPGETAAALDPARLRAAYAPLSSEAKAAIVSRIALEVNAGQAPVARVPAEQAQATLPPRRVLLLRRSLAWALPLVAAAATVMFGVWSADSPAPFALTPYRLELSSGVASAERGSTATEAANAGPIALEPVRIDPNAELVLVLRPERPVTADVAAHTYVRLPAGGLQPLAARIEAASNGAMRLFVSAQTEWPESGELVIWIGAKGVIPKASELGSDAPLSAQGWQRLERRFVRAPVR